MRTNIALNFETKFFEYFFKKKVSQWINSEFLFGFKYFLNESDILGWKNSDSQYFRQINDKRDNLLATDLELAELKSFDWYCGYHGERMNKYLRGQYFWYDKGLLKQDILALEGYLSNFRTNENLVALRRMPCEYVTNEYSEGSTVNEKGFLSTSLNLGYRLDNESGMKLLKNEALLILKIPKETCAAYIEEAIPEQRQRKEYELLIQRNTMIHIYANHKVVSNRLLLAEIITNK